MQALQIFLDSSKKLATDLYYDPTTDVCITARFESITDDDLALIAEEHRERVRGVVAEGSLTFVRRFMPDGTGRLRWLVQIPREPRFSEETLESLLKGKRAGSALSAAVIAVFPELADKINANTTQTQARELIVTLGESLPDDDKTWAERDLYSGIDASVRPLFPEAVYIPAVKDLAEDMKTRESSSFGRLLGMLLTALTPQLADATAVFATLDATLNKLKHADGTVTDERHSAVRLIESTVQTYVQENFPYVKLEIQIPPPELRMILSSARITVDDGVIGDLESKGDGLKRSVIFSIIRSYAELKRNPTLGVPQRRGSGFLLLFEEPELYLHPSSQRVLFEALHEISKSDQVLVSTHSPLFLSAEGTGTFVKMEKRPATDGLAKPYGYAIPIDLSLLEHKSRFQIISYETNNTAFFCTNVVLVEGDTDVLVIPHLARTLNPEWCVNKAGMAVCQLRGKGSIAVYKQFFEAFGVRVIVIADLDCLVNGFEQLGASSDCANEHRALIDAVDQEITRLLNANLSMTAWRDLATTDYKRQQWMKVQRELQGVANLGSGSEDAIAAARGVLGHHKHRVQRIIIEDEQLPSIKEIKEKVLMMLRKHDVFLLCRGTIERYYLSAGAQNQPAMGAFRSLKTSHFEETQIRQIGSKGTPLSLEPHHVESAQSGHDRPCLIPAPPGFVPASDRERTGDQPRDRCTLPQPA